MSKPSYFLDECNNQILSFDREGQDLFFCSKCLKRYKFLPALEKHVPSCIGIWQNSGIEEVNKKSEKIYLSLLDSFGLLSKYAQGIDTVMTCSSSIKQFNQTSLVYVKDSKPLGFITFSKRSFNGELKYSIDDFFVLKYIQRSPKRIGTQLFDFALKKLDLPQDEYNEIESKLVICGPSNAMISFLEKRGYNLDNLKKW